MGTGYPSVNWWAGTQGDETVFTAVAALLSLTLSRSVECPFHPLKTSKRGTRGLFLPELVFTGHTNFSAIATFGISEPVV
jgi:hypothetical protein